MKNYFYTTEIANKIRNLLDGKLPIEVAKNISVGDFTILPAPEKLDEYLPAVIINLSCNDLVDSNIALDVYTQQYTYDIYYLYPYTFREFEDTPVEAIQKAEVIANIFMNHKTIDDFKIEPTEKEAGGQIITSTVSRLTFDNAETKLFRALEIPAYIIHIEYYLAFRTFRGGLV
ncbi:hypothetical protein [Tepidimicrobium xylanilyticum]|uniref:Uncharacterized protein n=1 Tax=Tepidimicrobium xylanilyticum TaxID=1123352 RepID=A0A1H3EJ84_9FIRM|nr:hypothetical protein [Tepidimicrobium xylanilyticum]GMG96254.1 hypothetical protein EN5CB1_10800 [Tepidimicrobium xylanilyticum]SDX78843.1 hypothetical protein SAMN05660923_02935 [Tepidimicrobium xylanilyticum]